MNLERQIFSRYIGDWCFWYRNISQQSCQGFFLGLQLKAWIGTLLFPNISFKLLLQVVVTTNHLPHVPLVAASSSLAPTNFMSSFRTTNNLIFLQKTSSTFESSAVPSYASRLFPSAAVWTAHWPSCFNVNIMVKFVIVFFSCSFQPPAKGAFLRGSGMNQSTGRFTAPITGIYQFSANVHIGKPLPLTFVVRFITVHI